MCALERVQLGYGHGLVGSAVELHRWLEEARRSFARPINVKFFLEIDLRVGNKLQWSNLENIGRNLDEFDGNLAGLGTLTSKSIESVKIFKRRKINITCIQEAKWVGTKDWDKDGLKLWYSKGSRDRNGVDILVDEELREQLVEVGKISDRCLRTTSGLGLGGQEALLGEFGRGGEGHSTFQEVIH
ncbi:hypothetical protein KY284_026342 [Solanum tuberosum]|nr:hypothetical protein KY284_026342 [Solanum tuberosum]